MAKEILTTCPGGECCPWEQEGDLNPIKHHVDECGFPRCPTHPSSNSPSLLPPYGGRGE